MMLKKLPRSHVCILTAHALKGNCLHARARAAEGGMGRSPSSGCPQTRCTCNPREATSTLFGACLLAASAFALINLYTAVSHAPLSPTPRGARPPVRVTSLRSEPCPCRRPDLVVVLASPSPSPFADWGPHSGSTRGDGPGRRKPSPRPQEKSPGGVWRGARARARAASCLFRAAPSCPLGSRPSTRALTISRPRSRLSRVSTPRPPPGQVELPDDTSGAAAK